MKKIILPLCLIGLMLIGQSGAEEPKKPLQVAIYPLKQIGFEGALSQIITSAIQRELIKSDKLSVRDPEATAKALDEIGLSQSGHCSEDACTVEAGKILKAQKLIMGTVEKVDENLYTVSLRVIDVQTAKTEYQAQADCTCASNKEIRDFAIDLVNKTILVYLETGVKPKSESMNASSSNMTPVTPSAPSTPSTPPPPITGGKGNLSITTNPPGAKIWLDGVDVGVTPKTFTNLDSGLHVVMLARDGYSTLRKEIDVRPNSTTTFQETLSLPSGSIDVRSNAQGADIFIDDKYSGTSPKVITGVAAGRHRVKITKPPDYDDYSVEVSVALDTTTPVNANLSGKPGKIVITSDPLEADVYVDGQKIGKTSLEKDLTSGAHKITVKKSGYQSYEQTVTVEPNRVKPLEVVLQAGADQIEGMVYVPAGEFWMGCNEALDKKCSSEEKPYHKVYLEAFYIDKYEYPNQAGTTPQVNVNWSEAESLCIVEGKRLPTEAEWEKAARGTDGRTYPWGEGLDCSKANYHGCGNTGKKPAGSYPSGASPYGAMDMAGNVWEWTSDWYDNKYYASSPSNSPRGPDSGKSRVLRGSSWLLNPNYLRASSRGRLEGFGPSTGPGYIGFRCSRSP